MFSPSPPCPLGLAAILLGSCDRTESTNLSALFVFSCSFSPTEGKQEALQVVPLVIWAYFVVYFLLLSEYCVYVYVCMICASELWFTLDSLFPERSLYACLCCVCSCHLPWNIVRECVRAGMDAHSIQHVCASTCTQSDTATHWIALLFSQFAQCVSISYLLLPTLAYVVTNPWLSPACSHTLTEIGSYPRYILGSGTLSMKVHS